MSTACSRPRGNRERTLTHKLTEKQRRFVEAYMGEAAGNASRAAELAGYKGNNETLRKVGSDNLRKAAVQAAIAERVDVNPKILTREQVQQELTRLATEPGYKPLVRLKALDQLAKTLGLYLQKVRHEGNVSVHTTWAELRRKAGE